MTFSNETMTPEQAQEWLRRYREADYIVPAGDDDHDWCPNERCFCHFPDVERVKAALEAKP